MSKKKVYIAGPMSGITGDNRDAFYKIDAKLEVRGFIPLNPACLPNGLTQGDYMDICLAMVRACDAVYLLPGWGKSEGAIVENAYAIKLGKPSVESVDEL